MATELNVKRSGGPIRPDAHTYPAEDEDEIYSIGNNHNLSSSAAIGLTSGTTASHIHCCVASGAAGNFIVATTLPTFPNFPLGVTSGTYDNTLDLTQASSYNPALVTAEGGVPQAEAALIAAIETGANYLNIHTTNNPGGEIRGILVPAAAPEPATLALLSSALVGFALIRRRRH